MLLPGLRYEDRAHRDGIDEADWRAIVSHVIEVMNSFKVPDVDQKAVLEMLNGTKNDIVEET